MRYLPLVTFNGRAQSVSEWSRELGTTPALIYARLDAGQPIERVLSGAMVRHERIRWFRRAFADVPEAWPENQRHAVEAFYFRNLPAIDAAAELQITPKALDSRLHKARKTLAEYRQRIESKT